MARTVRFGQVGPEEKARILTESVALTGYYGKHAARLLRINAGEDRQRGDALPAS